MLPPPQPVERRSPLTLSSSGLQVPRLRSMLSRSMTMNSMIFVVFLQTIIGFVSAAPAPLRLVARDVWSPPITSPKSGDVWTAGSLAAITWDTSNPPANVTSSVGQLVLGYLDPNDPGEHLMLDSPLANGFLLSDGFVDISVPNVPPRDTYIVVLFGDSGNASPQFSISGGTPISSSSASSATSSDSSTISSLTSTVIPSTTVTTSTSTTEPESSSAAPKTTITTIVSSASAAPSPATTLTLGKAAASGSSAQAIPTPSSGSSQTSASTSAAWRTCDYRMLLASSISAVALAIAVLA